MILFFPKRCETIETFCLWEIVEICECFCLPYIGKESTRHSQNRKEGNVGKVGPFLDQQNGISVWSIWAVTILNAEIQLFVLFIFI